MDEIEIESVCCVRIIMFEENSNYRKLTCGFQITLPLRNLLQNSPHPHPQPHPHTHTAQHMALLKIRTQRLAILSIVLLVVLL